MGIVASTCIIQADPTAAPLFLALHPDKAFPCPRKACIISNSNCKLSRDISQKFVLWIAREKISKLILLLAFYIEMKCNWNFEVFTSLQSDLYLINLYRSRAYHNVYIYTKLGIKFTFRHIYNIIDVLFFSRTIFKFFYYKFLICIFYIFLWFGIRLNKKNRVEFLIILRIIMTNYRKLDYI